jgi:hypothetical protein
VRSAGRLPRATSDAGAAALGTGILLAGGRDAAGNVLSDVLMLSVR